MEIGTNNAPENVTRSRIFLAAWMAAEDKLPPDSLALIKKHDRLHAEWREAGWPSPCPAALEIAQSAVEADPLASIAFEFRRQCNREAAIEYQAAERAKEAA